MVPTYQSPRLLITLVAAVQITLGLALLLLQHELFKALQAPRPDLRLPFWVYGAISLTFGAGLLAVARRPLRHRALLRLIMICKLSAGSASIAAAMLQGLPSGYAFLAILAELAPAAVIGGVLLQLRTLAAPGAASAAGARRLALAAPLLSAALIPLLALGVLSPPLWEWGRNRGWIAPLSLVAAPPTPLPASLHAAAWRRLPSEFPLTPGSGLKYQLGPALARLTFTDPVCMEEVPGEASRFLVTERTGRILRVDMGRGGAKSPFLDLRAVVHYGPYSPEEGLLSLALHPGYADPHSPGYRALFVYYTRMWEGRSCNCLSRFQVRPDGLTADPGSETMLFCQAYTVPVHHGGGLAFGPDGFLYVGVGDGWWGAPNEHAQRIDKGLFSGILRLDVDQRGGETSHPIRRPPENGFTANYYIPNDNPFLAEQGENLEEFYAIGFRNPWRLSFDRQTGELWVADSGFERREEINRVSKGDNGGWAYLEGSVPGRDIHPQHHPRPEKPLGNELAPVHEYPRSVSYCTVGGFVYRGAALPELQGKYVYGDVSGEIWALTLNDQGECVKKEPVGCAPQPLMALCSLAEDAAGELYVIATKEISKEEGRIYKIERGPTEATAQLPRLLSETRLFSNLATRSPHPALTPYEINVPFWSDHAVKTRFVGTQSGLSIRGAPGLPLRIPAGTVFVKHFDIADDLRRPQQTRPLETRILVFTLDNQWYDLSYRWREDGRDAELVEEQQSVELQVTQRDGAPRAQRWDFPDRHACLSCHNAVSEGALGFSYRQLWRNEKAAAAGGQRKNQLERLRDCGALAAETLACDLNDLRALAAPDDDSRSLEDRARSYLDANCAYCHRNGVWYSTFDLRYDTPLAMSQLFTEPLLKHFTDWTRGEPVSHGNPAMAVRPGAPEDSFLYRRLNTTEEGRRMPPIGRQVVDEEGAHLIREWILSMDAPEDEARPSAATAASPAGQDPVR